MPGPEHEPGPVLTVITPVLNGRGVLRRCVESVAETARRAAGLGFSVEHIIADGGSTDGTVEFARALAAEDGGCISHVLTGPDGGQSSGINRGAALAKGTYIAWLNADDRYCPDAMAAFVGWLSRSRPAVGVGRCRFVDPAGRVVFEPKPPEPIDTCSLTRLLTGWFAGRSLVQPEVAVRADVWRRAGGLDESNHYTMDHELWVRLAAMGVPFATRSEFVAEQVVHDGQKTADNEAVARSIVGHSESAAGDCPDSKREVELVLERLRKLDLARNRAAGCIGSLLERGAGSREAEIAAWVRRHRRSASGAVACVDVSALGLGMSEARVAWAAGSMPAEFGVVLADSPTLRYGPGAVERLGRWLRMGGVLVAVGEPLPEVWAERAAIERGWLMDGLTRPPGRSPIEEADPLALAELLALAECAGATEPPRWLQPVAARSVPRGAVRGARAGLLGCLGTRVWTRRSG